MNDTEKTNTRSILTYEVNGVVYAIDIMNVIDVIEYGKVIKVPKMPPYIKGVIDLRGQVVPIMDMRKRLMLEEIEYDRKTCIIVTDFDGTQVGIIVERVLEVENVSETMFEATRRSTGYVSEIISAKDGVKLVPDYEKLLG